MLPGLFLALQVCEHAHIRPPPSPHPLMRDITIRIKSHDRY